MKKIPIFILFLALSVLSGCTNKTIEGYQVKDLLQNYLTAIARGDYNTAYSYISAKDKNTESLEEFTSKRNELSYLLKKPVSFFIEKIEFNGQSSSANVDLNIPSCLGDECLSLISSIKNNPSEVPTVTKKENISLIKEKSGWKVFLNLEDILTAKKYYATNKIEIRNIKINKIFKLKEGYIEVKNKGTCPLTKVELIVYYLDRAGNRIAEDKIIPVNSENFSNIDDVTADTTLFKEVRTDKILKPDYSKIHKFLIKAPTDWSGRIDVVISNIEVDEVCLDNLISFVRQFSSIDDNTGLLEVSRMHNTANNSIIGYIDLNNISKEGNLYRYYVKADFVYGDQEISDNERFDNAYEYYLLDCKNNKSYLELEKAYLNNKIKKITYYDKSIPTQKLETIAGILENRGLKEFICKYNEELSNGKTAIDEIQEMSNKRMACQDSDDYKICNLNFYGLIFDWYKKNKLEFANKNEEIKFELYSTIDDPNARKKVIEKYKRD